MTTYKTPAQIADGVLDAVDVDEFGQIIADADAMRAEITRAIEADRAQRQPEIYIVQNDAGDVVGVFRDADEATAAYQEGFTIVTETVWEPGEYAAERIVELIAEWEATTGYTAFDYALSGNYWKVGLDDDEAAQIARLMEWREAQK